MSAVPVKTRDRQDGRHQVESVQRGNISSQNVASSQVDEMFYLCRSAGVCHISSCVGLVVCIIFLLVLGWWCVSYFFFCWAGGVCHISSCAGLVVCVIVLLVLGWWCVS